MKIKLERKFTEKDIDQFIDLIYRNFKDNPKDKYSFDFTELEWISNQELLVFTAVIKYFVSKFIDFEIIFFKKGIPLPDIDIRVVKQLIQIWDVWKIYQVIPEDELVKTFGVGVRAISELKILHKIQSGNYEIYDRYGITPFVTLEKIKNYNDRDIEDILNAFYKLNSATREIVYRNKCEHPFINDTLSAIVSKELYENFLDHFSSSFFKSDENWAFMSLSLKSRVNEKKNSKESIQEIQKINFEDEALPEFKEFFWDKNKKEYKNISYLQFSFLDFGNGIVETLGEQYQLAHHNENILFKNESEILKYAFDYDSSRHPILIKFNKRDDYIPRGLFDILSIVHRYEGLLVARSNHGKIFYDFTNGKTFEEACSFFGDNQLYFPGTLISIYLPAIPIGTKPDISVIKPIIQKHSYSSKIKFYINIYHIINQIKSAKKDVYTNLLTELKARIKNSGPERTIYFSFKGYETDKRLTRKIIFFLLSDYEINLNNNVIVIYPPTQEILADLNNEILSLAAVVKNYIVHPLPFIYYQPESNDLKLFWLGVYQNSDRVKLNDLLFEDFSLSRSDFLEPNNITGHFNYFDKSGNLSSMFPKRDVLINYYKNEYKTSEYEVVEKTILKNDCLKESGKDFLYLCNGNYYQYQFIELINLLNKPDDCNLITEILFRRVIETFTEINDYKFIGITSSSHRILVSLINQQLINEENVILLDNYHAFDQDDKFKKIKKNDTFILFCDVISTGHLTHRLRRELAQKNATLAGVAVIVDTIDESFELSREFINDTDLKLISLYQHPILKYRRNEEKIKIDLKTKEVIRINPFTNLPISLTIKETNNRRILLTNNEFLEYLNDDQIKIGFLKFNNVVHPYFFDTKAIFRDINVELLKRLFRKIKINSKELKIFYPKDSGVKYLDIELLKNNVFKDHSLEVYELERFNTTEGWKFPHTTDHFSKITENKTILILDDGSCTGDSLIQMVDELALFSVKEIVLLCLIGRVNDHKREFFSRVTQIKAKQELPIKIEIFFGSHWHIPTYYVDDNPSTIEKNWLKEVIDLQNTPETIKTIARTIFNEITPKPLDSFRSYKYLPHIRGKGKRIPKKEIIRVREEIGKVIGYRFYRESFSYFNDLIKKYEGTEKDERNKDMELLCCTFLFEPYLYDKITQVMPDVIDKIEEFIDALIFGNPKKNNKQINIKKELTYEWDKKDIIHLFFIAYKREKLIEKLKDIKTFKKLINFVEDVDFAINYILYKILAYFPFNDNSLIKGNTGHFLHLLDISLQENLFPVKFVKEVKIFRSFISTLPSTDDYNSLLSIINENYRKLTDAVLHKESIMVQYDIMLVDLEVLENNYEESFKENFIETWSLVSNFIAAILTFSRSFPGFFLDRINVVEGRTEYSLRTIQGKLNDLINHFNEESDHSKIRELINKFRYKFLEADSDMFKIFNKVSTTHVMDTLYALFTAKDLDKDIDITLEADLEMTIDIPQFFLIDVIFNEIITNLRHRDKSDKIKITYQESKEFLFINISNKVGANVNHGGGNGLFLLDSLNKFPNQILKYTNNYKLLGPIFTQELRIKKV